MASALHVCPAPWLEHDVNLALSASRQCGVFVHRTLPPSQSLGPVAALSQRRGHFFFGCDRASTVCVLRASPDGWSRVRKSFKMPANFELPHLVLSCLEEKGSEDVRRSLVFDKARSSDEEAWPDRRAAY